MTLPWNCHAWHSLAWPTAMTANEGTWELHDASYQVFDQAKIDTGIKIKISHFIIERFKKQAIFSPQINMLPPL